MEAATSWAVLAAISWEQTMSSSYLPVCSTTLSADSLGAKWAGPGSPTPWTAGAPPRPHPQAWGNIHQLGGSPAHRLGGRDQAFRPPRVLGIKFLLRGCPLVVTGGQGGPVKDVKGGGEIQIPRGAPLGRGGGNSAKVPRHAAGPATTLHTSGVSRPKGALGGILNHGVIWDKEGSGVRPLAGICPQWPSCAPCPLRRGPHLAQPELPHPTSSPAHPATLHNLLLQAGGRCYQEPDGLPRSRYKSPLGGPARYRARPAWVSAGHSPSSSPCRS